MTSNAFEPNRPGHKRAWTADVIRVLTGTSTYMTMNQLTRRLWELRNHSGLNMPKAFTETVQSTLNHHTSQSKVWKKNGSRPEDDLFYSPRGKGSGEWAVHRDRAAAWLEAKAEDTGGDPVMTLATNIAREMVRNTIKTKGLDMKEWPARSNRVGKARLRVRSCGGIGSAAPR